MRQVRQLHATILRELQIAIRLGQLPQVRMSAGKNCLRIKAACDMFCPRVKFLRKEKSGERERSSGVCMMLCEVRDPGSKGMCGTRIVRRCVSLEKEFGEFPFEWEMRLLLSSLLSYQKHYNWGMMLTNMLR